ncbi:hypothetical protein [Bradyrhizobium nanningense]|uniref:hypothetical protein n=1 Tax=Bradyrhizobium nanningense TaxID=1325118 RepID=UPI0010091CB8|nr:hypothetical protein [Bradyrhizobium nanningense]
MKKPNGLKKVLLIDHVEGQCRCIIDVKDGATRAVYMCGEPVYQRHGKKSSSWCDYHYRQMHKSAAEQNEVSERSETFPISISVVRGRMTAIKSQALPRSHGPRLYKG